jgi:hypothetical protein
MKKCVFLVLLAITSQLGYTQTYKLHSVYIYGFTRYVIWPEGFTTGDFEILVLGDSPILDELKILAQAKKVGDRSIKITKINSVAEIKKCNILFLPASQSMHFNDVMGKVNSKPILLITEEPGLGAKGSDINFIMKDGKLAFELNQTAASKHNLKISNTLTSMAILI